MSLQKLLLTLVVLALVIAPTAAQETPEPVDVVTSFYNWLINYIGYDEEAEILRNPITDGSFRERPELSPALIESIDPEAPRFSDPFVCAQDVPARITYAVVDADSVLVKEYFGGNPRPFTHVVDLEQMDGAWYITAIHCQESVTIRGTVETVYNSYIADRESLQAGSNPLLTDALNAELVAFFNTDQPLGGGDPVLCAQDRPQRIHTDIVSESDEAAVVLVSKFFANNPNPSYVTLGLVYGERWQIDTITCGVTPETIATLLYNEFVLYKRFDMANNIERVPLDDWSYHPWGRYMAEDLHSELVAIYRSGESRPADPFLCAQDLPERITATAESDGDPVQVRISGAYPSGPDTFNSYDLATVTMATGEAGVWQMIAITCAR